MAEVVTRVFMTRLLANMRFERKKEGSEKTYKSKSLSQSRGKRERNPKHDTFMVEVGNRVFIGKLMQQNISREKKRRFTKDIQIQIGEPT